MRRSSCRVLKAHNFLHEAIVLFIRYARFIYSILFRETHWLWTFADFLIYPEVWNGVFGRPFLNNDLRCAHSVHNNCTYMERLQLH